MKNKLLLLLCLNSFALTYSQITFTEHILPLDSSHSFNSINFSDIDGDGDQDILTSHSSNSGTDKIYWHENLDGLGTFGSENLINGDAGDPRSPITGDFNGDGNADLLWRNSISGQIYMWFMDGIALDTSSSVGILSDLQWQIK